MSRKNGEMLKRLLATFRVEADEHLKTMTAGLLTLEKAPGDAETAAIVETVFREAHSLKGAARAVNHTSIEALCQSLEGVFAALKNGQLSVSTPLLDQLHESLAGLGSLLGGEVEAAYAIPSTIAVLIDRLDQTVRDEPVSADTAPISVAKPALTDPGPPQQQVHLSPATDAVRVTTARLDTVMRQVEELLSPRLAARQRVRDLRDTTAAVTAWKKSRAQLQPVLRRLERSMQQAESVDRLDYGRRELQSALDYLAGEQLFLATLDEGLARLNKSAVRDQHTLSGISDGLLQEVKEMQLLPVASLLETLPLLVRELARDQGKAVEFVTQGGEIEADRRVLEEMKDPLIHLMRNAIDHGIETPERRAAAGKPLRGTITVRVLHRDGGKLELLITDDGAGIDHDRVRKAAGHLAAGGLPADDQKEAQETLALVFQSGVTTSPIITDVSGRGLGLAIVREKIERLGGTVSIESECGRGTAFRIVLPLSMALFRGVLVRVGDQVYVIPSTGVERVARVESQSIRTVENRETIVLDGPALSLVRLGDVLEMPPSTVAGASHYVSVAVLGLGEARIAFQVDEILGEQEILLKGLGPQLLRVRNVTGASQLGTGQVVPVLNVGDLMQSAVRRVTSAVLPDTAGERSPGATQSILVAEDSITSRALLKNILESAGYVVTTAVDGMAAHTTLKSAVFDLVVSDVEMPRMDGFDLTARIRADKQLAELPVILVTALESREHRERGIDVGANAYIVKSSFDQSNLLETIRRLI